MPGNTEEWSIAVSPHPGGVSATQRHGAPGYHHDSGTGYPVVWCTGYLTVATLMADTGIGRPVPGHEGSAGVHLTFHRSGRLGMNPAPTLEEFKDQAGIAGK